MKKQKPNINQDPSNTRPANVSKTPSPEMLPSSIPMSPADLQALFDHLTRDGAPECDHTLRETQAFLKERNLNAEPIVEWLQQHGGFCDCEVRLNVMFEFAEDLDKLEQYVSSQLPKGGESGEGTVGNQMAPEGIVSNDQPAPGEFKDTGTENATSTEAPRPEGTKRAHSQIPIGHDVKVMEKLAKQLEWAIARDKSKLRLCREMIRKAKNARRPLLDGLSRSWLDWSGLGCISSNLDDATGSRWAVA